MRPPRVHDDVKTRAPLVNGLVATAHVAPLPSDGSACAAASGPYATRIARTGPPSSRLTYNPSFAVSNDRTTDLLSGTTACALAKLGSASDVRTTLNRGAPDDVSR